MAKGFYLGSRLRRYARSNQFGAESADLKHEIMTLFDIVEDVIGYDIKGTLVSDVFHLVEAGGNNSDTDGIDAEAVEDDCDGGSYLRYSRKYADR